MAELKIGRRSEGFCAFGIGDCGSTSSSTTSTDLTTVNSNISNTVKSKSQTLSSSGVNINDLNLTFGNISGGCNVNASQRITSAQTTTGTLSPSDISALSSKILADTMAKIDQDAQSKSGFFQTAPSSSTNVSNFKNNVTNALETNVSDSQILNIMNSVFNKNTKTVTFGNCDGKSNLDFSQDIVSQLVSEGIQKAVSEAVQNAETKTKQEIASSQTSTSKGGGLEDVIAALLAPLTALFGSVAAVAAFCLFCCCCCCCIIIFMGAMGAKGGGGATEVTSTVIPIPKGAANALSPANLAKVAQSLKG
jgi:hypothetical protein